MGGEYKECFRENGSSSKGFEVDENNDFLRFINIWSED